MTGGSGAATFGSVAVGSTGNAVPFGFTVAGGTTINSISVMTMGATGQDFAEASGSTCAAQAYSATTSCTINITVSPAAAGLRMGGLLISSNMGSTFVSLYATGTGPQLAFTPATRSTVLTGLSVISRIDGLAVDGSGNLYVGGSNAAEKATLAGGTYGSTSKLDTSLTSSAGRGRRWRRQRLHLRERQWFGCYRPASVDRKRIRHAGDATVQRPLGHRHWWCRC